MTVEEFVKKFYTEKTEQLKNSFDFETDKRNTTSYEIEKLNLDELQLDKLRLGISQLLTDNYYTILLGLDGSATIGEGNQETFKIFDENENLISDCGEIEAEAYDFFYGYKYEIENSNADFIATVTYAKSENYGRTTPVKSGYRPQTQFEFDKMQTSGHQTFFDREFVCPGETVICGISIGIPDYFRNKLKHGVKFKFYEGSNLIGEGTVLKINKILEE